MNTNQIDNFNKFFVNTVEEINCWFKYWPDSFSSNNEFRLELIPLIKCRDVEDFVRSFASLSSPVFNYKFSDYYAGFRIDTYEFLTNPNFYLRLDLKREAIEDFHKSKEYASDPSVAFGAFYGQTNTLMAIRNCYLTGKQRKLLDQMYLEGFGIKDFSKSYTKQIPSDHIQWWQDFKRVRGKEWWKITESEERYMRLKPTRWERWGRLLKDMV